VSAEVETDSIRRRRVRLDTAAIIDLLKRAVFERQIKISLHAAEEALAEEITRREIEEAMLSAELLEN
jgi:hypothetical protein